jgi:kinesin family protein 2/24
LNNGSNYKDKSECEIQERGVNGVSAVVRKRPIFNYELDRGDFDIVSIDNTTENMDMCLIHNCVMHPDMKQMQMKLTCFPITAAFDEHCSDDDIYHHIAEPLVKIAASGGISTILMFGQTGERQLMH